MDFLQLARARYSVRSFSGKPVEKDKLFSILEAGWVAPTAANKQPQRFLPIASSGGLARLGKLVDLYEAPLAIIVCGLKDVAWTRPQDAESMLRTDTAIAATHMVLEAWSLGVGSCWLGYFDPKAVAAEFGLPPNAVPEVILAMGYAAGSAKSPDRHGRERIPLEHMIWKEK